jgi:hypothetical protein
MSASYAKTTPLWARAIAFGVVALAGVALASLLLASYTSTLALILGLLAGALALWTIQPRRLHALARLSRQPPGTWMQRIILALLLEPYLALPVSLLLDQLYGILPRFLRSDEATLGLVLLSGPLAAEPARASLTFLRARVRGGRRGWRWVQRLLVTALLAAVLLPAFIVLALALATWLGRGEGVLLLTCAGLALASIGLLSWQIEVLFLPVGTPPADLGWRGWLYGRRHAIALAFAALLFALFWAIILQVRLWDRIPVHSQISPIKAYHADIEPLGPSLETFTIRETAISSPAADSPEEKSSVVEKQVGSARRGFLLREVVLTPLDADAGGRIHLRFADGSSLETRFCGLLCPESSATLHDLPRNAFYDAKDATVTSRDAYIDVETITLSIRDPRRGIVFAYLPPPYHHIAPILRPFLGASVMGKTALAFSGFIAVVVAVPILRPNRFGGVKDALLSWFRKVPDDDLEWLAEASQAEEDVGDVRLDREQRMALYRLLATRLDESDLRALYFGLDVPYDSLTGGGTIDRARELVVYCHRTRRLDELLESLAQDRPDLNLDRWGESDAEDRPRSDR